MTRRVVLLSDIYPSVNNPTAGSFVSARVSSLTDIVDSVKAFANRPVRTGVLAGLAHALGHGENPSASDSLFQDLRVPLSTREYLLAWKQQAYPQGGVRRAAHNLYEACEGQCDAIIAHGMYMLPAGGVAYELAKLLHVPYIVVCHGGDVNHLLPRRRRAYERVLRSANAVAFVSRALQVAAEEQIGLLQNAHVVGNGFDPFLFDGASGDEVRRACGVGEAGCLVGYVGNLERVKGIDRLPAVFRRVIERVPECRFVIVGDGTLRAQLEQATQGLPVDFVGRVPPARVARFMAALDVLVLPSRSEGWPTVIMEAFASGTPIAATPVGGVPEAIPFERMLVNAKESPIEGLAARVIDLLQKPFPTSILRDHAKPFTWQNIIARETELLDLDASS